VSDMAVSWRPPAAGFLYSIPSNTDPEGLVRAAGTWSLLKLFRPIHQAAPFTNMPSLFRFLAVVGIIAGMVYAGIVALATLVQPQPREISVTVPQDRFFKQR